MSFKTTVALLGGLAVLGTAMFFMLDGEGGLEGGGGGTRRILPGLLTKEVRAVELSWLAEAGGRRQVHLERGADGWVLRCEEVAGGRVLPALGQPVAEILESLQAMVARRRLAQEVARQKRRLGLGTGSRATITLRRASGGPLTLDVGADMEPAGMVVSLRGSDAVYEVDRGLRPSLFPEPRELWDRRIFQTNPLEVAALTVEGPGGETLELVREFSSWRVRSPFQGRADTRAAEKLRNRLLGLQVREFVDPAELPEELHEVLYTAQVTSREGESEVVRFGKVSTQGRGLLAFVGPDRRPVLVDDAVIPFLKQPARRYRDRHLHPRASEAVRELVVTRNGAGVLQLRRIEKGQIEIVVPGRDPVPEGETRLLMAPEEQSTFFRRLTGLKVERYGEGEHSFDPALRLMVRYEGDAGGAGVREILFGPQGDDGLRPVRVVGEPGFGWVSERNMRFLLEPYWELAFPFAGGSQAYYHIAEIRIRDRAGRTFRFTGRSGGPRLRLFLEGDGAGREMPQELVDPMVEKLVGLRLAGFAGERSPGEELFDEPVLVVRWLHAPGGTPESIPEEGRWHVWRTGRRREDGLHPATVDMLPFLVCLVENADLQPFWTAADWAHEAR